MQARSFRYRSASSHQMGWDALYLSGKLVALGAFKLHPRPYSNAFSKIQGAVVECTLHRLMQFYRSSGTGRKFRGVNKMLPFVGTGL